uniref:Uncharacterized protein n=1 Tax=Octopus bimaculoides TaxID=37653 RepID=A0A0L8GME6_OCTBM
MRERVREVEREKEKERGIEREGERERGRERAGERQGEMERGREGERGERIAGQIDRLIDERRITRYNPVRFLVAPETSELNQNI